MNRPLAFSLALTLALSGCHRADSTAAGKNSPPATDEPSAKNPVSLTPQTGRLISSDEVPLLEQIDRENTKVLAAVMPGVVRITASREVDPRVKLFGKNLPFDFHFGPGATHPPQQSDPSYGAGIILRKDGYIVTNAHVIQDAREFEVQLHDKRTFPAQVIASDASLDIAVLKIEARDLMALPWGDSDRAQIGEQVFAIGNPFNQEGSVSRGVISAIARDLPGSSSDETYLQTDAAINPGNSGGALVNIHGEVIGISTLIASTSGGNEGVGFAIPSNLASHAVEGLLKEASTVRGFLGVRFPETIDEGVSSVFHLGNKKGALLAGVDPGTPADKAGLHTGDFITEMDGHKIGGVVDLRLIVAQIPIGKEVEVNYIRDGAVKSTTVKIAEAPKNSLTGTSEPGSTDVPTPQNDTSSGENVLSGLQVNDLNNKSRQEFGVDAIVKSGVVVGTVQYSSLAELKGVERGDVIESVSINHGSTRQLVTAQDFADVANGLKPDQSVVLLIHHGKSSSFIYIAPQK
jgi:serine protease Do